MSDSKSFVSKQRLDAVFDRHEVDRPPALGGWLASPTAIMRLTGVTEDEYWDDPIAVSLRAYRQFNIDGLVDVQVPIERGEYRNVSKSQHDAIAEKFRSPEDVIAEIDKLPSPEEVVAQFDEQDFYDQTLSKMRKMQALCGDELYWCPCRWDIVPRWEWYQDFGYENYMMAMYQYPDRIISLLKYSAAETSCKGRVIARMVHEGIHPKGILCGKDLCSNQGPMVDPNFWREHWFPLVREAFKPLREAGARIVWHCDGNIIPVLDDILEFGVAGLQGFQTEIGFTLDDIVERRTIDGDKLIIFGPLSVTQTLLHGTPDAVKQEVRDAVAACRDKAHLALFTSNVIGPDVPIENVFAMYDALDEC